MSDPVDKTVGYCACCVMTHNLPLGGLLHRIAGFCRLCGVAQPLSGELTENELAKLEDVTI